MRLSFICLFLAGCSGHSPLWQRQFTDDKIASAEFPGVPRSMDGRRSVLGYTVPGKDVALFLSSSTLPDGERSALGENGKAPDDPGYRVTETREANNAIVQTAVAHVGDQVYRAVASWVDGQEDRSLTDRFVRSFKVSTDRR